MYLSTKTRDQKRFARQIITSGFLMGMILLVTLLIIGFPSHLWTPVGAAAFLRCFLTVGLLLCTSMVLMGVSEFIEDKEVRQHLVLYRSDQPLYNPESFGPGLLALLGGIACIVLVLRYIYLFLNPWLHIDTAGTSIGNCISTIFSAIPQWFWQALLFAAPIAVFSLIMVSSLCFVLFRRLMPKGRRKVEYNVINLYMVIACTILLAITISLGWVGKIVSESDSIQSIPLGYLLPWAGQIGAIVLFFYGFDLNKKKSKQ